MKQNKYRWREMKDEKPGLNEFVIFYYNNSVYAGSPLFGFANYIGYSNDNEAIMDAMKPLSEPNELIYLWDSSRQLLEINYLKWRKMCKLPGEK